MMVGLVFDSSRDCYNLKMLFGWLGISAFLGKVRKAVPAKV